MKNIILICLTWFLLSISAFSDLIPSDRIIDWSQAGVPGGIPSYPVWTNMTLLDPTGTSDCSAAIQSALDNCPPFYAVKIPSGTFKITNMISLTHTNVLRGNGTNNTSLLISGVYAGSWAGIRIGVAFGGDTTWPVVPSSAIKGATSITCSNVSGLSVSNLVVIEQQNDNDLVYNYSDEGGSLAQDWYYGTNHNMAQLIEIRSISGTNISFWPPLFFNYTNTLLSPTIHRKGNGTFVYGCGVENLLIGQTSNFGEKNIDFTFAKYSWISNIISTNCYKYHVQLNAAFACEVRDSLLFDAQGSTSGGSYGLSLALGSTVCKIENNAISHVITGLILAEMSQGNVLGYNYVYRTKFSPQTWLQASFSAHDCHPMMNLFEGNVGGSFISDLIHGSSSHNMLFRNRLIGGQLQTETTNVFTTQQNRAIEFDNHNRYPIAIANVIGNTNILFIGFTNGPNTITSSSSILEMYGYQSISTSAYTDSQVYSTGIILANYWIGTGSDGIPSNESVGSTNIPSSYYLVSKPSWFGNLTWPPIGPDVIGYTNYIPAQLRFFGDYSYGTSITTINKLNVGTLRLGQ
jgi:hypothetical protein